MKRSILLVVIALATITSAEARHHHRHHHMISFDSGQSLPHPAGCPWRAFCGCGASVELFGHPIPALALAAKWFDFPSAYPARDMAAVRRHHVMVLKEHVGGNVWMVYDANSGGHGTRYHARSISGYRIVNPHGSSW